jgi:hypothetical protein
MIKIALIDDNPLSSCREPSVLREPSGAGTPANPTGTGGIEITCKKT